MEQNNLHRAFDALTPSEVSRQRMLRAVLSRREDAGKEIPMKKKTLKGTVCVAAVVAALLALATIGYATDLFGLRSAVLGHETYDMPDGDAMDTDIISLQGLSDSPEYAANAQWQAFCSTYDADGAILAQIGNGETGLGEVYGLYGCYTREMADKLDEIAAQNGLSLQTGMTVYDTNPPAAVLAVLPATNDAQRSDIWGGYTYDNGSFKFDCEFTFTGEDAEWVYPITYEVICSRKGAMSVTTLSIGSAEDYAQWQYTTASGVTVTLCDGPDKALMLVDTQGSYLVINVLSVRVGDIQYGELKLPQTALQRFADAFDFAALA